MPITPDTKDWTWVLERECPECAFASGAIAREQVAQLIRDNAVEWVRILRTSSRLTERPSALEYACHVRDVFRLYNERLGLMLTQDGPTYPNWDQDATAVADRYIEQDPTRVAVEIETAAMTLPNSFDAVRGDAWLRTGTRSGGAHFTVDSFARYLVHDPVHHLHDVARGFAALG